jgi:cytoskeletal protein CcmA (bactofilin family)
MRNWMNVIAVLTLMMLMTTATPAYAQGFRSAGQIVLGRDVSLDSGQVLESNLIVLGGRVTMAPGSRIAGDLVVVGGNVVVRGVVRGNVLVVAGGVQLSATAQVMGYVSVIGGRAEKEPGAQVRGAIREIGGFSLGPLARSLGPLGGWGLPLLIISGWGGSSAFLSMWRLFWAVVTAMGVAIVSLLVVRFLPRHATTIVETIRDATAASFGVGLLTGAIGLIIIAVLIATVCLAPLGMLLTLPLALATLLGWTMIGYWLGQRLMPLLNRRASPEPMIVALVGTLVLTAGQQGLMVLSGTPCLGFLFRLLGTAVWLIAGAIGLGAVVLSRFGTQRYPAVQPLVPQSGGASTPVLASETFPDEQPTDEPPRRRPRRKKSESEATSHTSQEARD